MKKLTSFLLLLIAVSFTAETALANSGNNKLKALPEICKADNKKYIGYSIQIKSAKSEAIEAPYQGCKVVKLVDDRGIENFNEFCKGDYVCSNSEWIKEAHTRFPKYPECTDMQMTRTQTVYLKLNAEEFAEAQCAQIDECLSDLDTKADMKVALQWSEKLGCK